MTTTHPKPPAKRARKPKWPLAWDGDRLVTTTAEATAAVDRSRLSASTAKAVISCPARMVADRLMRGPEDPLDPAPIGTAAHTVLERLFALPSAQRTPASASLLLDQLMLELASPDTPRRWPGIERDSIGRWRAEVGGKAAGIFELEDPRQVLVRRTEWALDSVEVAGVPFTGFIDRADIARDGERFGCRIVDYKSGKYKGVAPFGDDHGDQLRVYAEAVRVADGRLPISADLPYIGARRARSVSLSRREMSATLEGFARAWVDLKDHVAAQAFPATPTPLCGWCPLVNSCPSAARDGRAARVEGLPTAAELGIPVLRPLGIVAIASVAFAPDGEPVVIPVAGPARDDPAGYGPADTREPPADSDSDTPDPAPDADPGAAHMDPQEPGTTGMDSTDGDSTDKGGAIMTSLLREDKPWEQTAGPDGLLNPNSYSATAVFGIVELAVELLHKAGVHLGPAVVNAMSRTLAHVVLALQRDLSGSTSYQDGVNTRLRGALRTAVATMPPPFGGDAQAWSSWVARVIRRTESIAKAAVALFDDDPGDEPPYADLVGPRPPGAGHPQGADPGAGGPAQGRQLTRETPVHCETPIPAGDPDMSIIETSVRTQIVLGAVNAASAKLAALTTQAAGDPEAMDRLPDLEALIARSAAKITAAIDPKSALSRLIDAVHGSKVFTAVITEVVREPSSTRGLVTLRTRPSQFHPDGVEQARTERTDSPDGLLMARTLRGLTGHRVALWIEEQTTGNGARKVRIIQHVKDLGRADDDRETAGAA